MTETQQLAADVKAFIRNGVLTVEVGQ